MAEDIVPELSPEEARKAKQREADRRYREKHREAIRLRNRVKARRYYAADPEKYRARARSRPPKSPEASRAYYVSHGEERRAYALRRRAEKLDACQAHDREYYWTHVEQKRAANHAYHLQHQEERCEYQRTYRNNHPEHRRQHEQKRRARKANAPINDFTAKQWRVLCKAVGYRCAYCDKKFLFKQLTPDHITPLSRGGSHTLSNIIPSCLPCNRRKYIGNVPKATQPFLLLSDEEAAD